MRGALILFLGAAAFAPAGSAQNYVPPFIVSQPASLTVPYGTWTELSVQATGSSLAYQWYFNGSIIAGAASSWYVISSPTPANSGSYTVTVSNASGTVTSAAALFTVLPAVAPAITQDPESQWAADGGSVYFSVGASGSPAPTYQWCLNGAAIPGATSSGYSVSPATPAAAGNYCAIVSNSVASVTSGTAVLTVGAAFAPYITVQAASEAVAYGNSAGFTVSVSGTPPLTYQWYLNGAAISGATNSWYSIDSAAATDAGSYTMTVANSLGSVTSTAATLTVSAAVAPTITTQPESQTVSFDVATYIELSVSASGSPNLSYQWFFNGTAISNATGYDYYIWSPTSASAGNYTVTVSNAFGSVTSNTANIAVLPAVAPTITTQPESQTVTSGSTVQLSVNASGSPNITFQWYDNGVALPTATGGTLSISSATAINAGSYSVVVSNSAGSVTSNPAIVAILTSSSGAPTITAQPISQTVGYGGYANLSVAAVGSATLSYQWYDNGVAIPNANSSSYSISSAITAYSGSYTVTVTNGAGSVTSTPAAITVLAAVAPAITAQPVGQTLGYGNSASLIVYVSGSSPISYQWYLNGTAILGATSSWYDISSATTANSGTYTVTAGNSAGSVTSSAAVIAVGSAVAPSITSQPAGETIAYGGNASLGVSAAGSPNLSYQWYFNGTAIPYQTSEWYDISSATSANAGSYTVTVSNGLGSVTSNAAIVTVAAAIAPYITSQPAGQTLPDGNYIDLYVNASGSPNLSYQWYLNGTAISGATNNSYSSGTGATPANSGSYSVTVTNGIGSATSSPAVVTILPAVAPTITEQPASQIVSSGVADAELSVGFTGSPPLTYQWYLNGTAIPDSDSEWYYIDPLTEANAGSYTVTITNSVGSATSNAATLTLVTAPTITAQPQNQTVSAGLTAAFSVAASGGPAIEYKWLFNGSPISDGNGISGSTTSTLTIANAASSDSGNYSVVVATAVGSVTSGSATLTVIGVSGSPPVFSLEPQNQQVTPGASATFSALASGSPSPAYQWTFNGQAISGATNSYYTIASAQLANAGSYAVTATNALGSILSSSATLTVSSQLAAPSFTTQPQSQFATLGSSVTFTASASGVPAPTYQWYFGGLAVSGATNATLTLTNVQAANSGNYQVVASNASGQAASSPAVLTVSSSASPLYEFTTLAGTAPLPGSADGTGSAARFNLSSATATDGAGNIYVADSQNQTIRKITPGGVVTTLAGMPGVYGSADGTGSAARFYAPSGVAVDGAGNVYVADWGYSTIRKITPGGVVTTFAGTAGAQGSADGTGSAARFIAPFGIAIDGAGNLYVSDMLAETIRKITPGGVVTTLAGAAGVQGAEDGTGSGARFYWPGGVAVDGSGNVFVADEQNDAIRKVTPGGVVTTVAGSLDVQGSANGTGNAARFCAPLGIAVDGSGNLYVADTDNQTIRMVAPGGAVTTLGGSPGVQGSADGTGSAARFCAPYGLAVDGSGNLYVADTYNYTIRKGIPGSVPAFTTQPQGESVASGSGATLSAAASGTPVPAYQWYFNGQAISGATNASYAISSVQVSNSGSYTVTASNVFGSVTSNGAVLTVSTAPVYTIQPQSQSVSPGASVIFTAAATSTPAPAYQWFFNSMSVSGATSASYSVSNVQPSNSGSYFVVATNAGGSTMSSGAMLTVMAQSGGPTIGTQPVSQTMTAGSTVVFSINSSGVVQSVSSASSGSGPRADASGAGTTYQWYLNGIAITGATNSMLVIQASSGTAGAYTCLVTNSNGSVLSNAATLALDSTTRNPGRLVNLSVNAVAGGASQILTVGFYNNAAGTDTSQTLLIQALGPTLYGLGVTGFMPDPQLNIFNGSQSIIGSNAGWGSPVSNQLAVTAADAATYATPLSDPASRDSAVVAALQPGGYTVQVSSVSGATGTTLAALYDDTPGAFNPTNPRLINISCRLQLGAKGVLTAGFTVGGETSTTVLIRASGPALLAQGVTGVMPDPQLMVFDANQNVITSNAGWGGSPVISSIASSVYAAAFTNPGSADSAVVLTLPPGCFTVQATSVSGAAGDVMIEVFDVP
ncbi:MAG: immunoglobulin domain-containing protein [Opitutaceae bacterium]|jgi:hypothetical protein